LGSNYNTTLLVVDYIRLVTLVECIFGQVVNALAPQIWSSNLKPAESDTMLQTAPFTAKSLFPVLT